MNKTTKRSEVPRKFQAQRKFAQGAYVPGSSSERRVDVAPPKDAEDKRPNNVIYNKITAMSLLNMVANTRMHEHTNLPIVLVERLQKKINVPKDNPRVTPRVIVTKVGPSKKMLVPKSPVIKKIPSNRYGMALRSRSPTKRKKIIKKNVILQVNPYKKRKLIGLKKKTNMKIGRRSPIMSGFSSDDDMPLITAKALESNHKTTKRNANAVDSGVEKLRRSSEMGAAETTAGIVETEITAVEVNPPTSYDGNFALGSFYPIPGNGDNFDDPTNTTLQYGPTDIDEDSIHLRYEDDEDSIKQMPTFYGRSEIERWIGSTPVHAQTAPLEESPPDDIPLDGTPTMQKLTKENQIQFKVPVEPKKFLLRSSIAKSKKTMKKNATVVSNDKRSVSGENIISLGKNPTAPAGRNYSSRNCRNDLGPTKKLSSPEDKHPNLRDKQPKPGEKRNSAGGKRHSTDKTRPTTRVTSPANEEDDAVDILRDNERSTSRSPIRSRAPSPCPSSKITSIFGITSASQRDLETRCTKCRYCHKVAKYLELMSKAHCHFDNSQLRSSQDTDVYAFSECDAHAKEPPLLGFRQNRRNNKDSNSESNLYLDLLPNSSHIVQLVSVKIPNQDKNMMKAKLVPKSQVNQMDLKKNDEEIITLMEQENFLDELLNSLNDRPPANSSDNNGPTTSTSSVCVSASNKKTSGNVGPHGKVVDAPTFYPTDTEFENPYTYLENISPKASRFGLCKIVPPKSFKPDCNINQLNNFTSMNQYPGKMFSRWGAATREYCAFKASANVAHKSPPLINNVEVNVPKLYHIVQRMGGFGEVIEKNKWQKVAEEMNYPKGPQYVRKLDQVYVKFLVPYDALTSRERQEVLNRVENAWNKRYKRMLHRAQNPLLRQKQLLGEASSDEEDDEDGTNKALDKADDCIVQGRTMNLNMFEKIANTTMQMFFGKLGREPTIPEIEDEYWRFVVLGSDHVCINSAAVDTGDGGYGFPKNKGDAYAKHPWNLKVLSNSPGSVLRSLGSVLSVTVPTLHLGMVFSTSCWHRDPHGLPWIEYLHQGASKIWYGIPDEQTFKFRKAVESLCPAHCQNKSIWLPSDITMIPPNLLKDHNITLSKIVQKPGEFIVVFPKAYSCSISTGYTVSESVYYAPFSWLETIQNDFQEVRESFEPTMFPLEQLLIAMAQDARVPLSALPVVHRTLDALVRDELLNRAELMKKNVTFKEARHPAQKKSSISNLRELHECEVCRATLYLSKVTSLFDKKKGVYYCLQHALRILETPAYANRDFSGATVIVYHSQEQLEAIIDKLRKRLFSTM